MLLQLLLHIVNIPNTRISVKTKTRKHSASPQNTKTLGFASKHENTRLRLKTRKHSASPQNTKTLGFASKH
ncbi:MAG: hypothetical protein V1825_02005 [Candidatus Falkowbacteria bacterium]